MKQQIDPNIFCVMLGANKKDGKRPVFSASQVEYVVENKTKALQVYAEYCRKLDQFKSDEWTSGIVQMFHPVILPGGHYTTYSNEENICEYRFGYQEEKKEDEDGIAVVKKPKASMQRNNKKRNF